MRSSLIVKRLSNNSMYPPDQLQQQPDPMAGLQTEFSQEAREAEAPLQPDAKNLQLVLSDQERRLLAARINENWSSAIADHRARMNRYARYENLWRSKIGAAGGTEGKSNYKVPLIEWQLLGKLAKEVDSLFGDDAEIIAKPTGPSDHENAAKVGAFMTWRVFEGMRATSPLIEFIFTKLKFGRAHAYCPYGTVSYTDTDGQEVVDYEGPQFFPLSPDDFIPAHETVRSLHEFSFMFRRYYATPDDLLAGEEEGQYVGITKNWLQIWRASQSKTTNPDTKPVGEVAKENSGENQVSSSKGESLEIWEWYGGWRMLQGPIVSTVEPDGGHDTEDASEDDFDRRDKRKTDLRVRYVKDCDLIISSHKLRELYPRTPKPRPFVEACNMKTGEYWCKGIVEQLEEIEAELTANLNLSIEAGERSVAPLIAVKRSSGSIATMHGLRYEPGTFVELDEPQRDIYAININANLQYPAMQEQRMLGYAERVTGLSDQALGRAIDRPNAPRTARGQLLLNQNESIRLALDVAVLREDFGAIMEHIWLLDSLYSPEKVFFRVTESKANGLFETEKGFGVMTAGERGGKYDFDIKFATSSYSREAEKEKAISLAQIGLATPLVMNNPRAQWFLLDNVFKKHGDDNFARYVPKPPEEDMPMDPEAEWVRMLEGQAVRVSPVDRDDEHIQQHQQQIAGEMKAKQPDKGAINLAVVHVMDHIKQARMKMVLQEQAQAQAAIQGILGGGQGMPGQEQPQMPQPGMPQGMGAMGGMLPQEGNGNGINPQDLTEGLPQ